MNIYRLKKSKRVPGKTLNKASQYKYIGARLWEKALPVVSVVFLVIIIIVPLSLFIWFLFFTDVFVVQALTVVDAREHTAKAVREILNEQIEQKTLKKNIFFLQSDIMESEIVSRLPQVRTVHITRILPGTVKAVVQEKTPKLLLLSDGQYFFVDKNGIPYEAAQLDRLPGVVLPIVKNDDRDAAVALGVAVVEPSFITFVHDMQAGLPDRVGAQLAEIHIPSLAAREVHLFMDNNIQVRFDVTRSSMDQLNILNEVLTTKIEKEDREKLEYIDLRIANRVYYKIRE